MRKCVLCKKTEERGNRSFFRVPRDERKRRKWSEICGIDFSKQAGAFICADHFSSTDIIEGAQRRILMPNAMPIMPLPLFEINIPTPVYPVYLSPLAEIPSILPKLSVNSQTQTDPIMFEFAYHEENRKYKELNKKLQAENRDLKDKLTQTSRAISYMSAIFTEGQIRKMMAPGTIQWQWKDISTAMALHASGPKAYIHLYNKGFPLPHISTLQRWCSKVNLKEGLLTTSIRFMKHISCLTSDEKLCVLVFKEIKVVGNFMKKPANKVQVVMARGLQKSWKQPVFYDYDCEMRKDILCSIISELHHAGFPVVALVFEMGLTNSKLLKELNVSVDRPWFRNPVCPEESKIFTFDDTPRLLKLIRSHFLDTGLMWNNERLSARTIADMLNYTKSNCDKSITLKVSKEHISQDRSGNKVMLAAQLFSNTTANAIRRCYSFGANLHKPIETADFVQLINDWFDILNSAIHTSCQPGKELFGALADQKHTLMLMNKYMSSPIMPNKNNVDPFQEAVVITNTALIMLQDYVKEKYYISNIVTNRLNQDVLEHLFTAVRRKGVNEHPTPKEFKYRLRKYILERNMELLYATECGDTTEPISSTNSLEGIHDVSSLIEEIETGSESEGDDKMQIQEPDTILEEFESANIDDMGIFQEDPLEYISGFLKFNSKYVQN